MENPSKRKPKIRNKIYNSLKAVNLSQRGAAFLMGLDNSEISKWERGEREPGLYNAIGLAIVTEKRVEDIFSYYRREWQEKIGERKKLLDSKRQNPNVL